MSPYIQKSIDNLKAADCLVESSWYEASAHPAYYSIFLLSKELLHTYFGIKYEEQSSLFKGPKSHQSLMKRFAECVIDVPDFEPNDYLQWFNQTNMMRNKADYKPSHLNISVYKSNVKCVHDFCCGINNFFKLY